MIFLTAIHWWIFVLILFAVYQSYCKKLIVDHPSDSNKPIDEIILESPVIVEPTRWPWYFLWAPLIIFILYICFESTWNQGPKPAPSGEGLSYSPPGNKSLSWQHFPRAPTEGPNRGSTLRISERVASRNSYHLSPPLAEAGLNMTPLEKGSLENLLKTIDDIRPENIDGVNGAEFSVDTLLQLIT